MACRPDAHVPPGFVSWTYSDSRGIFSNPRMSVHFGWLYWHCPSLSLVVAVFFPTSYSHGSSSRVYYFDSEKQQTCSLAQLRSIQNLNIAESVDFLLQRKTVDGLQR